MSNHVKPTDQSLHIKWIIKKCLSFEFLLWANIGCQFWYLLIRSMVCHDGKDSDSEMPGIYMFSDNGTSLPLMFKDGFYSGINIVAVHI